MTSGPRPNTGRTLAAHGETKTVYQWAADPRCFLSKQGFVNRVNQLGPEPTETDIEAALCFTQRLWRHYYRHGFVSAQLLDEVLSG